MATCPNCGRENEAGFRFCPACGADLEMASQAERRQLATLLFCDVSGSTAMGERLDAEPFFRRLEQRVAEHDD